MLQEPREFLQSLLIPQSLLEEREEPVCRMELEKCLVIGKQFGYEGDELKTWTEEERTRLREERQCEREFAREAAEQTHMQQERTKELE